MSLAVASVEPPIPVSTEFKTVDSILSVIRQLDAGDFYWPAILIERMLWNPRLRGAVGTRLNGHIATQIRWEPVRNNAACRRAARDMAEDWPTMAPSPQRQQFNKWGLLLGISFAQRVPMESPTSGRRLFRLRPYWPGWMTWNWDGDSYRAEVRNGAPWNIPSPSHTLAHAVASSSPWIVHEPFGEHSWREGLIHALWRVVFGHDLAFRDLNRGSEKNGIGMMKAKYPAGAGNSEDKQAIRDFTSGLRRMGSEGVVPLEQRQDSPSFDVEPLEFTGVGGDMIAAALNTAAIAMAIVLLGHNLTTEVKGGSYAAAGVGEYIRSDIKANDFEAETASLHPGLAAPWALENYGDPEIAPRAVGVTDPPTVNEVTARTYQQLMLAIREMKQSAPNVDVDTLLERFRIPLLVLSKTQVPVPEKVEPEMPMPMPAEGKTVQVPGAMAEMPAKFAVGDRVTSLVDHMPGMNGMAGTVQIVRTSPPYYGVVMDGESEVHKWLAEDEVAADGKSADAPASGMAMEPAAPSGKGGDSPAAAATLALTPSDLASIIKVDEGRESVGRAPVGGDIGGKWIRQHAAELAAVLPVDPAAAPPSAAAPAKEPAKPSKEESALSTLERVAAVTKDLSLGGMDVDPDKLRKETGAPDVGMKKRDEE